MTIEREHRAPSGPAIPVFESVLVEGNLKDGYWIDAVDLNNDSKPDLIASGLAVGEVVWYENPSWKKRIIAKLDKPVAMDWADIDGDGYNDLVICHDYGSCMYNCKPEDGKVSWFRNPGKFDGTETWTQYHIADLMASHRLRFGHFTQTSNLELMVLPVVGTEAVHGPVQVMLYERPADVLNAKEWKGTPVDTKSFRIIHDVIVHRFGPPSSPNLDSVIIATEEGITWLYYSPEKKAWEQVHLGSGEPLETTHGVFGGCGNIDVGRIGDDPFAYIGALEPFHGSTVAVYSKSSDGLLQNLAWTRRVLDVFGDPNEAGEGTGHHVRTADFDGDGNQEFLVALRGPMPWQGVFHYRPLDAQNGVFVKTRVSTSSAARITIADFDGDGRLDFATTGYYTPGYFLCDNPEVRVFYNRTPQPR